MYLLWRNNFFKPRSIFLLWCAYNWPSLEITFQAVPADVTIDLPIKGRPSCEDASSRYLFDISLEFSDKVDYIGTKR